MVARGKGGKLVEALPSYQVAKGTLARRRAPPNPATLQGIGLFCVPGDCVRVSVPECGSRSLGQLK